MNLTAEFGKLAGDELGSAMLLETELGFVEFAWSQQKKSRTGTRTTINRELIRLASEHFCR
jgi:hypothetical protein